MGTPDKMLPYSPTLGLIESHVAIYKIYVLRNPLNEEIFYVGQTKMPLETRLSGHIAETGANRDKINYIKNILESGQRPIIEAIETIATTCYIDTMAVNEREIYWIKYHKSLGCNLLNKASTSPDTKCHEYHGYLSAIKKGSTSWHYYYCGKTAGGYKVYDEKKLTADGFVFKPTPIVVENRNVCEKVYNPWLNDNFLIKLGAYVKKSEDNKPVTSETYPIQPCWTQGFRKEIPPYNSIKVELYLEYFQDYSDYEPEETDNDMSDYEPESDSEDDDAVISEREFERDMWVNSLSIISH